MANIAKKYKKHQLSAVERLCYKDFYRFGKDKVFIRLSKWAADWVTSKDLTNGLFVEEMLAAIDKWGDTEKQIGKRLIKLQSRLAGTAMKLTKPTKDNDGHL